MIGSELHAQLAAERVADLHREAAARAAVGAARPAREWRTSSLLALSAWRRRQPAPASVTVSVSPSAAGSATLPACC